jgi:hypothetical protein
MDLFFHKPTRFVKYIVPQTFRNCLKRMAGTTRLELATSAVTGQRSNQLNYVPTVLSYTCRETAYLLAFPIFRLFHGFLFFRPVLLILGVNGHQTGHHETRHLSLPCALILANSPRIRQSLFCRRRARLLRTFDPAGPHLRSAGSLGALREV